MFKILKNKKLIKEKVENTKSGPEEKTKPKTENALILIWERSDGTHYAEIISILFSLEKEIVWYYVFNFDDFKDGTISGQNTNKEIIHHILGEYEIKSLCNDGHEHVIDYKIPTDFGRKRCSLNEFHDNGPKGKIK